MPAPIVKAIVCLSLYIADLDLAPFYKNKGPKPTLSAIFYKFDLLYFIKLLSCKNINW